jgi:hypothetical protein
MGKCFLVVTLAAVASSASAQTLNTINCTAFTKFPNGWAVGAPTTFDLGTVKGATVADKIIQPGSDSVGGIDLFAALEQKCGKK